MAFDDVEKRLNSSLDDLIASSKKAGAGRGGRGAAQGRGKAGRGRGTGRTARNNQTNQGDLAKKALKQSGGGVQKQGAAKGKVKAVPLKAQRGGGRGSRGGGAGGRGSGRQQLPQALHPAALKITIRNDKFTGEAPAESSFKSQGSDPFTVGGYGYYGQAAGPLMFGSSAAAAAPAAAVRQRPVWAAGSYYNGTQHDNRTGGGVVRRSATQWPAQAGYGSSSLRMDQEAQRY